MNDNVVTIKVIPNGSLRIENGNFEIQMLDGKIIEKKGPFTLCRCGHSERMPFCDASHKTHGFQG